MCEKMRERGSFLPLFIHGHFSREFPPCKRENIPPPSSPALKTDALPPKFLRLLHHRRLLREIFFLSLLLDPSLPKMLRSCLPASLAKCPM